MKELEGEELIDKQLKDMSYDDYIRGMNTAMEVFNENEVLVVDRHINGMYFPENIVKYAKRYKEEFLQK